MLPASRNIGPWTRGQLGVHPLLTLRFRLNDLQAVEPLPGELLVQHEEVVFLHPRPDQESVRCVVHPLYIFDAVFLLY